MGIERTECHAKDHIISWRRACRNRLELAIIEAKHQHRVAQTWPMPGNRTGNKKNTHRPDASLLPRRLLQIQIQIEVRVEGVHRVRAPGDFDRYIHFDLAGQSVHSPDARHVRVRRAVKTGVDRVCHRSMREISTVQTQSTSKRGTAHTLGHLRQRKPSIEDGGQFLLILRSSHARRQRDHLPIWAHHTLRVQKNLPMLQPLLRVLLPHLRYVQLGLIQHRFVTRHELAQGEVAGEAVVRVVGAPEKDCEEIRGGHILQENAVDDGGAGRFLTKLCPYFGSCIGTEAD